MGIEIERKFLLDNFSWQNDSPKGTQIRQGYLNSDIDRTVRIRTKGEVGFLTVKGRSENMTRKEFEYEIPIEDAKALLAMCEQPIIEKTRFNVVHRQKVWEIDVFEGINEGLVVAEIELDSEDEVVELPEWVGEEVTSDPKYYNSSLIANPYTNWKAQ